MIKNFEEYINEDYFSKLASRKDNQEVRKEDITLFQKQIKDMEWVDLGLPSGTLWSSIELHDDDGCEYLNYYEYQDDYLKDIFFLPTKQDVLELFKNCDYEKVYDSTGKYVDEYILTSKINGNKISFIIDHERHKGNGGMFAKTIDGRHCTFITAWMCVAKTTTSSYTFTPDNQIENRGYFSNNVSSDIEKCAQLVRPVKRTKKK